MLNKIVVFIRKGTVKENGMRSCIASKYPEFPNPWSTKNIAI